mmetsp:Transcript_8465/g.29059  ORF Transcript_8465/g.29059 Transcript_8465/m.29059 type:complete len:209 (-) Transcript_8465:1108-1734(-)
MLLPCCCCMACMVCMAWRYAMTWRFPGLNMAAAAGTLSMACWGEKSCTALIGLDEARTAWGSIALVMLALTVSMEVGEGVWGPSTARGLPFSTFTLVLMGVMRMLLASERIPLAASCLALFLGWMGPAAASPALQRPAAAAAPLFDPRLLFVAKPGRMSESLAPLPALPSGVVGAFSVMASGSTVRWRRASGESHPSQPSVRGTGMLM